MKRLLALALLAACAAVPAASASSPVTVYAAASLTNVFPRIAPSGRFSFGGSNALAAQIEQGAPADVFASADTKLPARLHAKGLVGKPVVFTHNALVVIVPRSNPAHVRSGADLARAGVKVDVAAAGVPVGNYTRTVLQRLRLTKVLRNVVSEETDVRAVLAKVALGEADAGFVYATDAKTVAGKVKVLQLPARAQPKVAYALAVVSRSRNKAAAEAFVRSVLSKAGQAKLAAAGFLPLRASKAA